MRPRALGVAIILAVLSGTLEAQTPYVAPWDPDTETAAEAAAARLGAGRAIVVQPSVLAIRSSVVTIRSSVVTIRSSVVTIPALSEFVGGSSVGVVTTVQQTKVALTELGATETAGEVRVELPADVLFDFDKADVRPEAVASLEKVADVLRAYAKSRIVIEGHTDSKGTSAYNQTLSERRAASVRAWLEGHGLKELRLESRGAGATQPAAPETNPDGSDNPEGRRKNRRVRIVITKVP